MTSVRFQLKSSVDLGAIVAHGCDAAPVVLDRLFQFLSWVALALGIGTAGFMGYLTVRSYSPVPWMDPWFFIYQLDHLPRWSLLWAQHNEHRIAFPKLFYLADFYWFHAKGVSTLIATYAVQVVQCVLLTHFLRKLGWRNGAILRSAVGLILFSLFSPAKREDFVHPWEIAYVLPIFAITLAIIGFALSAEKCRSHWFSLWIATGWIAAVVASFSLLSGFLIWPMLCIEAWMLGLPRRGWLVTAGLGIGAAAVNAIGFRREGTTNLAHTIQNTREVFVFFNTLMAESWPPLFYHVGQVAAWIGIFICIIIVCRRVAHPSNGSPLEVGLAILALTCAGAAGMTAVGRYNLGFTNRYEEPVLLFWAAFGLLLFAFARGANRHRWVLPLQIAPVLIAIANADRIQPLAVEAKLHSQLLNVAGAALASGVSDRAATAFLTMPDEWTFGELDFLRKHKAALYAAPPLSLVGAKLWDVYRIKPGACDGELRSYSISGDADKRGLSLHGSAWNNGDNVPLSWLVIADHGGRIVGFGANDSAARHPGTERENTWSAFGPVPRKGDQLTLYGVISETEICPISGVRPITGVSELAEARESAQSLTPVWLPTDTPPRVIGGTGTISAGVLTIRSDNGDTQVYFDTGTDLKQFAALVIKAKFERADTVEFYFARQVDGRGIQGSVSTTGEWILLRANLGLNPYWSKEASNTIRFDPTGARGTGAVTYIAGIWGSRIAVPADADFFETGRVASNASK